MLVLICQVLEWVIRLCSASFHAEAARTLSNRNGSGIFYHFYLPFFSFLSFKQAYTVLQKRSSSYSSLSQITLPSNKMVFNVTYSANSKFSNWILLVNLKQNRMRFRSKMRSAHTTPFRCFQLLSCLFICIFNNLRLWTEYYVIMWSLYKSETLMEVVGYTPKEVGVSVLKLRNLIWPLNTLPHQGHINTIESGDLAYSVETSMGYQSAGMLSFFQV